MNGSKNFAQGNSNTINANKAIVSGNQNRVYEMPIDISELY